MKKVFQILTLIMLILTIFKISDTYAKYFAKATGTAEQEVGKWTININEQDIYSDQGDAVEFIVEASNTAINANTTPGKIAPGITWCADIVLNPSGTEVAVRYDIEFDTSTYTDIHLQCEAINTDENKEIVQTGEKTYTGIISLADIQENKQEQITLSITWENNESNNLEDTEIGNTYGQSLQIPVKVICTQYLGEVLTEYTE